MYLWAGESEARSVPHNQSIIHSINQAINSLFNESDVIVVKLRNLWPSMKRELRIQYNINNILERQEYEN